MGRPDRDAPFLDRFVYDIQQNLAAIFNVGRDAPRRYETFEEINGYLDAVVVFLLYLLAAVVLFLLLISAYRMLGPGEQEGPRRAGGDAEGKKER